MTSSTDPPRRHPRSHHGTGPWRYPGITPWRRVATLLGGVWHPRLAGNKVLAHVRGETGLSCRIVDDPAASRIVALRKRLRLSRQKFADRFGLDVRAVQEWEQGRRVPDRAARVLLTVIDRDPEAVVRALGEDGGDGRPGHSFAS